MTKSNLFVYSTIGLMAVAVVLMPESALATQTVQPPGTGNTGAIGVADELFGDVVGLVSGNLGTVIGLVLSVFGLWMWLVQQATWGLLIVIGGAALTAFPGIYTSLNQGLTTAFQDTQPTIGN